MQASVAFFRCLGMQVVRGRTFTPEEDLPNGSRVALLSQNLWKTRFGSDPQILNKTIALNGKLYSAIGIIEDSPVLREFGPLSDVYVPFQIDPNTRDEANYFKVVARLRPGITLKQARDRLQAFANANRDKFPNTIGSREGFTVTPFREALVGDPRRLLLILMGSVGLVLLMACANVANLLLVRASGRRREIAIRTAIGASRGRMIRQLLTESLLLSMGACALGVLVGYAAIRALLAVNTGNLHLIGPGGSGVHIDWRVM